MCNCTSGEEKPNSSCPDLISAFIISGFSSMLPIRIAYESAPYSIIRFGIPENLFGIFLRRIASSMELWFLPGFILADILDYGCKGIYQSQPSGSEPKSNRHWKFWMVIVPSIAFQWFNFFTYVILLYVVLSGGTKGHLNAYYWTISIAGFIFGTGNPLIYAADYQFIPYYLAGENTYPILQSIIHYIATLIVGNRRKFNTDKIILLMDIVVAIIVSLVAAAVWTYAYLHHAATTNNKHVLAEGFDSKGSPDSKKWHGFIACILMILVGLGFVYCIYPVIAPGMIVPFYLIHRIEMILLVITAIPAVTIAILRKLDGKYSPTTKYVQGSGFVGWTGNYACWHFFDLLIPLMIILGIIFIYSIHYRDSNLSRSIVNQPKMSTFLSILFYMCYKVLLPIGFAGMVGNGSNFVLIPQLVGIFLLVFLGLYSEGYLTEYKRHDPQDWPTDGMTRWNQFCYWLKMASKNTNEHLRHVFTKDLRRDLLLCTQKHIQI